MSSPLKRKRFSPGLVGQGDSARSDTNLQPESPSKTDTGDQSPRTVVSADLSALHLRSDCFTAKYANASDSTLPMVSVGNVSPDSRQPIDELRAWVRQDRNDPTLPQTSREGTSIVDLIQRNNDSASSPRNLPSPALATHNFFKLPLNHLDAHANHDNASSIAPEQSSTSERQYKDGTPDHAESKDLLVERKGPDGVKVKPLHPPVVTNDLVWSDSEITGHNPDDPDDDGYGINGIGFKPTALMAEKRRLRRQRQIVEWNKRADIENRFRRRELRNKSRSDVVISQDQSTEEPPTYKRVRFLDSNQDR